MELIVLGNTVLIDDEDYAIVEGRELSIIPNGYVMLNGQLLHRLIMKPPAHLIVDHRDHNILNCHKSNLRVCTHAENSWNRKTNKNSISRGIFLERGYYRVRLTKNYQRYNVGAYLNIEEAIIARDILLHKLYGEFAYV